MAVTFMISCQDKDQLTFYNWCKTHLSINGHVEELTGFPTYSLPYHTEWTWIPMYLPRDVIRFTLLNESIDLTEFKLTWL